ncbi:MAG: hypothetical protein ACK5AZ_06915 [Bryobacteraceae bacterium]
MLYFSAPFRQTGTDQFIWAKLFVADAQGIRLLLQRERVLPPEDPSGVPRTSNPFQLRDPFVSDDGAVIAFTGQTICTGSLSGCIGRSPRFAEVMTGGETSAFGIGAASLSRNGRFLLRVPGSFEVASPALLDRLTGQIYELPPSPLSGHNVVTDNGGVLIRAANSSQLLLWRRLAPDAPVTLAGSEAPPWLGDEAQIDASGSIVVTREVVPRDLNQRWTLDAVAVATGARTRLFEGQNRPVDHSVQPAVVYPGARISLSADGRLVLFTSLSQGAMQMFLAHTDGSGVRELPRIPGGINEAVLSGNGRVVYAATWHNGLLRYDIDTGELRWLVERLAVPNLAGLNLIRGSYTRLPGSGFLPEGSTAAGFPPLPRSMAGITITVGGIPAPLVRIAPDEIAFQVPWEAENLQAELKQLNAPFELGPFQVFCCDSSVPRFLAQAAIHQGFDGFVTPERPAKPGEIVHFYMTGLGDVVPPVPTGHAAPSDPPARAVARPAVLVDGQPAELLFAGLAPGLVGVYQLDVRLPLSLPDGTARVTIGGGALIIPTAAR